MYFTCEIPAFFGGKDGAHRPRVSKCLLTFTHFVSTEKGDREHQLSSRFGDEVGQVLPWTPPDAQDSSPGKIQAGDYRQQHSPTQVRLRSRQLTVYGVLETNMGALNPSTLKHSLI